MIFKRWTWAILIAMSCLFVACSDDDDNIIAPSEIVSGVDKNQVDLNLGESKIFAPTFEGNGNLIYKWTLNDKLVSDKSSYKFEPKALGKSNLKFEVSNESGSTALVYKIRVCGIGDLTSDVEGNSFALAKDAKKTLKPDFEAEGDLTYKWSLDGKKVSEEKEYTFVAKTAGNFQLKFEVNLGSISKSIEYSAKVNGTYSNGVFIVNEGWFGHEKGSVNFWDRKSNEIIHKIYAKENPEKELGVTTQYACINNSKLYLVSKQPANLVVVNSHSMKELGRLSIQGTNLQARGFVAESDSKGYLSSSNGIFPVDLNAYKTAEKIEGVTGEVGNMLIVAGKLYALKSKELIIIKTSDNSIIKKVALADKAGGMVKDKDGNIWVAAVSKLLKVRTSDLTTEEFSLTDGLSINPSYGFAWNAGSLTYSKTNNSLYFMKKGGWSGIRTVGCYNIDTKKAKKVCDIDQDYMIYGAGTYIDPVANKLYVTAIQGYGQKAKKNRLYVYDLEGNKEKVIDYQHFYFAALCVTNE